MTLHWSYLYTAFLRTSGTNYMIVEKNGAREITWATGSQKLYFFT